MALAGFAQAPETFYLAFRKGGPHYLPFDLEEVIRNLLPRAFKQAELSFLSPYYDVSQSMMDALDGGLTIRCLPKGSWFCDREPIATITGPSFLVSWLEPTILQLHYPIQVATMAKLNPEGLRRAVAHVTCDSQRKIIEQTLESIGEPCPPITTCAGEYMEGVQATVRALMEAAPPHAGPNRVFEVGMRAVSCMEQHALALDACEPAGLTATSNVQMAWGLGMTPVGTMGHEHVQRFGNDRDAFEAMRYRVGGPTSYLLDTFDTLTSGIPNAFLLMRKLRDRKDTVRFDSGDKKAQLIAAVELAREYGIEDPRFILEDGFTVEMVREFEVLRKGLGLPASNVLYGLGGGIVRPPWEDPLTRDRVAAVYKLTESRGNPTMKFGNEELPLGEMGRAGKSSLPGQPVSFHLLDHTYPTADKPLTVVGMAWEEPPPGYARMDQHCTPRRFLPTEMLALRASGALKIGLTPGMHDEIANLRRQRRHTLESLPNRLRFELERLNHRS